MANWQDMSVSVPLIDLPSKAVVTGKAIKDGGRDPYYGDKNSDTIVLSFRNRRLDDVLAELAQLDFDKVEITAISFG